MKSDEKSLMLVIISNSSIIPFVITVINVIIIKKTAFLTVITIFIGRKTSYALKNELVFKLTDLIQVFRTKLLFFF